MAKRPDANDILRSQGHDGVRRAIAEAEVVPVEEAPSNEETRPNGNARGKSARLVSGLAPVAWRDFAMIAHDEAWLVKGLLPSRGLVVLYGRWKNYKSFIALDLATKVARGAAWAGRECRRGAVIYVAGEGGLGLRKRVEACKRYCDDCGDLPIYFIIARTNLGGIGPSDLPELIKEIRAALGDQAPILIVFDTLNRALGSGEENGEGMRAFTNAAEALSDAFDCLVLAVHHQGASDDKRPRGHTTLPAAAVAILRAVKTDQEDAYSCDLILEDAKDAPSGFALHVTLRRVSIDDEETTLLVDRIEVGEAVENAIPDKTKGRASVTASLSLFRDCVITALKEHGKIVQPFDDRPSVRAVEIEQVRKVYYERRADEIEVDSLRAAARRHLQNAVDRGLVMVGAINGKDMLWLPNEE